MSNTMYFKLNIDGLVDSTEESEGTATASVEMDGNVGTIAQCVVTLMESEQAVLDVILCAADLYRSKHPESETF